MGSSVTNAEVERSLRNFLQGAGYRLNQPRAHGQTGVDVRATRGAEDLFIEVIGYQDSGPTRSKAFYEVFFRAISRLKLGAKKCVIALPTQFEVGLPARAAQYGTGWERIGIAFPELFIWLVDTETDAVSETKWNDWLTDDVMPQKM